VTLPPPGDPRQVRWRYHFTDFRLGRLLATLPMTGVTLSDVLNGVAGGSGTVPLASEQVRRRDPFRATVPRRSCCWAERLTLDAGTVVDSRIMWGGIVLKRERANAARAMKLSMVTWPGYFQRRLLGDRAWVQADKFTIMRTLVRDAVQQLPVPVITLPVPSRSWPPVVYGSVPQSDWDALYTAGWRGRAGDPVRAVPAADAAAAIRDRLNSGQLIFEDWSWHGDPPVVEDWNDYLTTAAYNAGVNLDNRAASAAWLQTFIDAHPPLPTILYHPLAPPTPPPVTYGTVSQADWDALYAAGWRGRAGDNVERFYPPLSLMTFVEPGTPGSVYYAPSPYPTTSPHHFLLDVTDGPLSGVLADRTYLSSDLKPTLEAITELGNSGDGFDWRMVPYLLTPGDLGSLRLRLDLGFPRLGRVEPPDLRWSTLRADSRQRWGFMEDLTVTEDGSAVHNRVTAVGAGTGPDQIRATADSTETLMDELAAGYPVYEGSLNSSTQDDRTYDTVHGKALGALLAGFASEVQVTGIKVRGDLHPTVTSYDLGDDVTLRVGDTTTGQPTTIIGQLVGRTIEPAERGRNEVVTLDVQGTVTG
jgi:hypothetical protein